MVYNREYIESACTNRVIMAHLEYTHTYTGLHYLLVLLRFVLFPTNLDDSEIISVRSFVCKITIKKAVSKR